jgi:UPF0755 protein
VRLSRGSKWFLAFFMLFVAAGAAGVYWLDSSFFGDDFEAGVPVDYEVGRGQTVRSVGDDLAVLNVIRSSVRFRLTADEEGLATGLQPGLFEFETGMEIEEAIEVLAAGPLTPPQIRFTVREGLTVEQALVRLAEQFPDYTEADFRQVLDDRLEAGQNAPGTLQVPAWIPEPAELPGEGNDPAIEPFEGLLFPETYDVVDDASPLAVLQRMVDQLGRTLEAIPQAVDDPGQATPEDEADPDAEGDPETEDTQDEADASLDLTFYERLVLASLIERETRVNEERDVIAGVITNRLEQGMRLQIDATVVYAMGGGATDIVLLEDLEIDHPHNTYQIDGLPPTPIAGAGAASLQAAFAPADVTSLFYVLAPECDGSHVFADTADEHNVNVQAFRDAGRCQQ